MDETTLWTMLRDAAIRHAASAIAGVLVSIGAVQTNTEGQVVGIISGILLWGASFAWSWWQKQGHAKVKAQLDAVTADGKVPSI